MPDRAVVRFIATVFLLLALPIASRAAEPTITANALFEGRAMLSIDGSPRVLKVGQTSPEGVRLVSASAREAVVEVAGREIRLVPGREPGGAFNSPERREVPVARNDRGEYRLVGTVNGRQVSFMVDTGANVVALSGLEADRLGVDYRRRGEQTRVMTAAGPSPAWAITLDRVEVSGIMVRNVQGTVIEGPHPEPALLGMSWLQRVGLREESGVMYLRER
jgi:aspartyl protease family protein